MDEHEERVIRWGGDLIVAYAHIGKVLLRLPLPIELPTDAGEAGFIRTAHAAIVRALDLIADQAESTDEIAYVALRQTLLDWLTAMDLAAIELELPRSWREEVFDYTIARVHGEADLALERIIEEHNSEE